MPGGSAPSSWVLKTGGRRAINKVVAIGFRPEEREPALVVKMARLPDAEDALRSEAANLAALHSASPRGIHGAPRLLGASSTGEPVAVGESFESGVPLMTELGAGNHRPFALGVTDWLIELARTTSTPVPDWRTRLIQTPLEDFGRRYGDVVERAALEATRARLLALEELPGAFEQRDCSPWNILRGADGALVVMDWESAEPRGLPLLDLVYYLTFSSLAVHDALDHGTERAYRASRDPSTALGRIAGECEHRYLTALGLDSRCLHPLRLLAWIVHARGEYDRLASDGGDRPAPRALGGATFARLWREELTVGDT